MQHSFTKNEDDLNDVAYAITFTHREIRALLAWFPKNFDSDDEVIEPIGMKLKEAREVIKEESR